MELSPRIVESSPRRLTNEEARKVVPRKVRQDLVWTVGGHEFRILPKLEGKWSGEARTFAGGEMKCKESSSNKLAWHEDQQAWSLRRILGSQDGQASIKDFKLYPIGSGLIRGSAIDQVSGAEMGGATITMREESHVSPPTTTLYVHSDAGQLLVMETMVLLSDSRMVRTIQFFNSEAVEVSADPTDMLTAVATICEDKVAAPSVH